MTNFKVHKLVSDLNLRRVWELFRSGEPMESFTDNVPHEFMPWFRETWDDLQCISVCERS